MKALLMFIVSLLASPVSWAGPSLDDIAKDRGLIASVPTMIFGSVLVKVNELCTDGANIRPVHPYVSVCAKRVGRTSACVEEKTVYLSTPIRYLAEECADWRYTHQERRCIKRSKVEREHRLSFEIPVYRLGRKDVFNRPEFTVQYTIPACEG